MPTSATQPTVTTSLDSSAESATATLYRAAIGPISNDFYLPIFMRFEAVDRAGPSWNWSASLYTLNWMVWRHLWGAAGIYAVTLALAAILAFGAARLLFQLSEPMEWGLWLVLLGLSFGVPGVYGNAWLHAASRKKMAEALSASGTLREACAMLNQQASTRQRFIVLAVSNVLLAAAVAGTWAWLAHPQDRAGTGVKELNLHVGHVTDAAAALPAPATSGTLMALPAPIVSAASSPASVPAATLIPSLAASAPMTTASAGPTTTSVVPNMAAVMSPYVPRRLTPMEQPPPALPATATSAPLLKNKPVTSTPAAKPDKTALAATKHKSDTANAKSTAMALPKEKTPPAQKHYVINVGLFAKESNANKAHAKLLVAGLASSMQVLKTSHGDRTRVRVGPFKTRAEADAAAEKIRALELEAMVIQP